MADESESIITTIFNGLYLFVEIIVLLIRIIATTIISVYQKLTAEEKSVQGEVVLITGAGHGIGKELAMQYSELGATIVCWDINEQMNLDTVNLIKSKGRKAYGYTVDVTNREKVFAASNKVLNEVGAVTILLNNAGIMPQHELLKHTEKEIRMIFDINVIAHFWMYQAFLPKMIENDKGHLVSISSMVGLIGSRNIVPYCGSKFAVRGIQEALSEELRANYNGKSNINFTTIFPYAVGTGLFRKFNARFANLMPIVEPKDAAASIISAQRKNLQEASIPRDLFYTTTIMRMFPNKAGLVLNDFFQAYVESDK